MSLLSALFVGSTPFGVLALCCILLNQWWQGRHVRKALQIGETLIAAHSSRAAHEGYISINEINATPERKYKNG